RDIRGEHDLEAVRADPPAKDVLRVGINAAARVDDGGDGWPPRPPRADADAGGRPPPPAPSARSRPTATTAAAPSPNSPLATRFAKEASPRCTVNEHSSTAISTATPFGRPPSSSWSRAIPLAPATQPRPKTGTRTTSARRPSRGMSRASRDGAAIPVTETE